MVIKIDFKKKWNKLSENKKTIFIGLMTGILTVLFLFIYELYWLNYAKGGELAALGFALLPLIIGDLLTKLFNINPNLSLFGIYVNLYLSLIFWFIISALIAILIYKLIKQLQTKK